MAYIPSKYKVTKQQYDQIFKNMQGLEDTTWETLLMADYVYHHEENDYEDGLSFLKRLVDSLGQFHPEWNLEELKNRITTNSNPPMEFARVVQQMLGDREDVEYYQVMV